MLYQAKIQKKGVKVFDSKGDIDSTDRAWGEKRADSEQHQDHDSNCSNKHNKLMSSNALRNTRERLRNSFNLSTDSANTIDRSDGKDRLSSERIQFEKFREYIELKRKQANSHFEKIRNNDRPNNKKSFVARTKKSYEMYRQYIGERLPDQAQQTRSIILRRQKEEAARKHSKRSLEKQYENQRGNILLVVFVGILLVIVAISIVQLVG